MVCALVGCKGAGERYVVPEGPLPANTVILAQMMRELSERPGFTEAMLAELDKGGKVGAAFLTPTLVDRLREMIVGKDWQGLDRFPGWTMRAINPTIQAVGHVVGGDVQAEDVAARQRDKGFIEKFLDVGEYSLEKAEVLSLDGPSTLPGFTTEGIVSDLGAGVTRGDDANAELAPMHAESQRLANVLNRLSLNGAQRYAPMTVTIEGKAAESPQDLVKALVSTGHSVEVADARYFANFGHFHYKGQDVMMPFWVDTQIRIPGTKRPLLVPVSHAEYEWKVRGPKVNADVSWYFGIDGKAEFRTMDTLDQTWVMVRHAHEYRGADAVEVTRLVGKMVVAYMRQHVARPELAFGGYYALGVCQDSIAAIEKKLTGKTTLFPNTADAALFDDARDAEVNELIAAIPKDRNARPPEPERIFGSLPVSDAELSAVSIPGLGADLVSVHAAWQEGRLERVRGRYHWIVVGLEILGALLAVAAVIFLRWRVKAA
jgi:hypothetical protein